MESRDRALKIIGQFKALCKEWEMKLNQRHILGLQVVLGTYMRPEVLNTVFSRSSSCVTLPSTYGSL